MNHDFARGLRSTSRIVVTLTLAVGLGYLSGTIPYERLGDSLLLRLLAVGGVSFGIGMGLGAASPTIWWLSPFAAGAYWLLMDLRWLNANPDSLWPIAVGLRLAWIGACLVGSIVGKVLSERSLKRSQPTP